MSEIGWSHTGIQPLIQSFIAAFKANQPASAMRPISGQSYTGAIWYKTILNDAVCPVNGAPSLKPDGFDTARDTVNWAVVVPAGETVTVRVTTGGVVTQSLSVGSGLQYGSAPAHAGEQKLEILRGSTVAATAAGGRCSKCKL